MELKILSCKGSSLLVTLLILMIMSLFASALVNMTIVHSRIAIADDYHQAAYYFAEAGLQHQLEAMANHMEALYRDSSIANDKNVFYNSMVHSPIHTLSFQPYKGQQVSLKITKNYEIRNNAIRFTVYCSCTVGNAKRIMKARVEILWSDPQAHEFQLNKSHFSISQYGETY